MSLQVEAKKSSKYRFKRKDYSAIEKTFESGKGIELLINKLDLKPDAGNKVRFLLDARALMVKTDYPQNIKIKAYTKDQEEKETIVSIINSTVLRKRQARKLNFDLDIPTSFSSNDLLFDVYDSSGELRASFTQYLEKLQTQNLGILGTADCDNSSFGDCQLQYIINSIDYQMNLSEKVKTVVNHEPNGKYSVNLPILKMKKNQLANDTDSESSNGLSSEELMSLVSAGDFIFNQVKLNKKSLDSNNISIDGTLEFDGEKLYITTNGKREEIKTVDSEDESTSPVNSSGFLNLTAQADPPSSPSDGDIYNDSSDAICAYSSLTSRWNKISGVGSCEVGTDQAPDAFDFLDTDSKTSALTSSNTLTITAFDNAPISISGQGTPMYSIDSGAFTSSAGNIYQGQTVQLRLTASAIPGQSHTARLTIGSVSDDWTVTSSVCPDNFAYIPGSAGYDSFGNADANYARGWCVSQYEMSPQDTSLWTRIESADDVYPWSFTSSSGAGKAVTAKGGGDSYPITEISRNEAAAACANDLTTKDGTALHNGKLLTAYFWSNIGQAIVDDGINWSGGSPGAGNLSRGNSSSPNAEFLAGVAEGTEATQPTDGVFYYTAEQGRSWRMGDGEASIYDFAGNAEEWFDDLHDIVNGGYLVLNTIDANTLSYEYDNSNGPSSVSILPSEKSTHDTTANGVGSFYTRDLVVISGTSYAAFYGGDVMATERSGVFSSSWYGASPSMTHAANVGFRCIIPSQ